MVFSSCSSQALECKLCSCGAWSQLPQGMWKSLGPGIKPVSPALADGFLATREVPQICFFFFPLLGSEKTFISFLYSWGQSFLFNRLSKNHWLALWTAAHDKNTSVSSFAYQHVEEIYWVRSRKKCWVFQSSEERKSALSVSLQPFVHLFSKYCLYSCHTPGTESTNTQSSELCEGLLVDISLPLSRWKVYYHSFPLASSLTDWTSDRLNFKVLSRHEVLSLKTVKMTSHLKGLAWCLVYSRPSMNVHFLETLSRRVDVGDGGCYPEITDS